MNIKRNWYISLIFPLFLFSCTYTLKMPVNTQDDRPDIFCQCCRCVCPPEVEPPVDCPPCDDDPPPCDNPPCDDPPGDDEPPCDNPPCDTIPPPPPFIGTMFVAPHGLNLEHRGSEEKPFKTLAYALRKAKPGDNIFMHTGVYPMNELWLVRNSSIGSGIVVRGTKDNPIKVSSYNGEVRLKYRSRKLILSSDYIEWHGLIFDMPWKVEAFGRGLVFRNNIFEGRQPSYGAIEYGGIEGIIEGNIFHLSKSGDSNKHHSLYIKRGPGLVTDSLIVRNNKFYGADAYVVHIFDQKGSGPDGGYMEDIYLENNIISGSRSRFGVIVSAQNNIRVSDVFIRNNQIYGNKSGGILVRRGNVVIENNCFGDGELRVKREGGIINEKGSTVCYEGF